MTSQFLSDAVFTAYNDIPNGWPRPPGAAAYFNFQTGAGGHHITDAVDRISATAAEILTPVNAARAGYYYGASDIALGVASSFDRIEYDDQGRCLGLRVEGTYTQLISSAQRQDATAAVATGAAIATDGTGVDAWHQWYSVTPSAGATEASATFETVTTTTAYQFWAIDVRGRGIVQLSMKSDASGAYANFDLGTGECWCSDAGLPPPAMIRRAGGYWTIVARFALTPDVTDLRPCIASVAAIDTGLRAASGVAFSIRSWRVSPCADLAWGVPGPWPALDSDAKSNSDDVIFNTGLLPLGSDFTVIYRVRSGWYPDRIYAGLFIASPSAGYFTVRADGGGNFAVFDSAISPTVPIYQFGTRWEPGALYKVGVSRSGQDIAVSINGETFHWTSTLTMTNLRPRICRGVDTNRMNWGGHLQRGAVWTKGVRTDELAVLCERWL